LIANARHKKEGALGRHATSTRAFRGASVTAERY
jgi:hypothetical protein